MKAETAAAIAALNRRYLLDYPREAAKRLESLPAAEAAELVSAHPVRVIVPVWEHIAPDVEEALAVELSDAFLHSLLAELEPVQAARLLSRLDETTRAHCLEIADVEIAQELRRSVKSVVSKAHHLGLKKHPVRLKEMGRENVSLRYRRRE